jgi:hypothetical protein
LKGGVLAVSALTLAALAQGCLLFDIPPAVGPLDDVWQERMLTGRYGAWKDGTEVPPAWRRWRDPDADKIASYPVGAQFTKYGIEVRQTRSTNAGWELVGGLVGQVDLDGRTIELYGRQVIRVHGPVGTLSIERDVAYDFFLVLRPSNGARGRVVRHWRFPPEDLALTGSPVDPAIFRRSTRTKADIETILHPAEGSLSQHYVDGYLDSNPESNAATVTVTGLKRPFREVVDLSR